MVRLSARLELWIQYWLCPMPFYRGASPYAQPHNLQVVRPQPSSMMKMQSGTSTCLDLSQAFKAWFVVEIQSFYMFQGFAKFSNVELNGPHYEGT